MISRLAVLAWVLLFASAAAAAPSCRQAVGAKRAAILVRQCLIVSPATHPPCNARNPCGLIADEIGRGCDFIGPADRPAFCAGYRGMR
ncbi:MAG: hypothetical protein ABI369_13280 [Acetobacteraceae bacterium]